MGGSRSAMRARVSRQRSRDGRLARGFSASWYTIPATAFTMRPTSWVRYTVHAKVAMIRMATTARKTANISWVTRSSILPEPQRPKQSIRVQPLPRTVIQGSLATSQASRRVVAAAPERSRETEVGLTVPPVRLLLVGEGEVAQPLVAAQERPDRVR